MTKQVTKRQAESARRAIAKANGYPATDRDGLTGPKLRDRRDDDGQPGWQIIWEEGPYEWPFRLGGGFDEELFHGLYPEFEPDREKAAQRARRGEVPMPTGVWAEPINHWSVALYKEA